jgi:uncharacterized protein
MLRSLGNDERAKREAEMAHIENVTVEAQVVDLFDSFDVELEAEAQEPIDEAVLDGATPGETLVELGLNYATGRTVAMDLVAAHKWFNIAASRGSAEAARLRREIAPEMNDAQIGAAQRAARDWLRQNPAVTAAMELRQAA